MIESVTMTDVTQIRISGLIEESCVDGPGIRLVIFAQGCPHHCPGCHNPKTHNFEDGYWKSIEEILNAYRANPLLDGITCSGGEPFRQPLPFATLARKVHELGGNVVTYTGYTLEALRESPYCEEAGVADLLAETDILVDGPFKLSLASMELPFRGSSNQRLIYLRN